MYVHCISVHSITVEETEKDHKLVKYPNNINVVGKSVTILFGGDGSTSLSGNAYMYMYMYM